jgi:hypothetical protein
MPRIAVKERVFRTALALPLGSKVGLLVLALGIGADLIAHLTPGLDHDHGAMTGPEVSAHLVVFVGMALVLIAIVVDGVRSGRRSPSKSFEERRPDAVR